eukprot:10536926-Lingulodinium_polyedra.AAC.1
MSENPRQCSHWTECPQQYSVCMHKHCFAKTRMISRLPPRHPPRPRQRLLPGMPQRANHEAAEL